MKLSIIVKNIRAYRFFIILLCSVVLGSFIGYLFGPKAAILKPLGDIFLNLIFTFVVPLVFFSISSAIANMADVSKMLRISMNMLLVFLFTSIVAAIYMLVVVKIYPPAEGVAFNLNLASNITNNIKFSDQLVNIFTVPDLVKLLSRENILALIVFSILVGLATSAVGEKGKVFSKFLQSGTDVFMKVFSFIMYYAPIGFFAYFAVIVGELGSKILESYYRATISYYLAGIIYFVVAFTIFAYLSGRMKAVKIFWKNAFVPSLTALATCSSAASIPANLEATKKMGISAQIYELVVPLGAIIHKDGSVLGGMLKIAFLFGIFHLTFSTPSVIFSALMISILVGTVMGAIPSGGMVGELLILSMYGFPPQTLIIIAAISIIIDPLATMLNTLSNTVSCMMVARLTEGKAWYSKGQT